MKRLMILLAVLAMAACEEETTQDTSAVPLTQEAAGHFCQMILLEHEGPKAQAHLSGLPGTPLFFSQVRDVIAYLRMPEQSHEILAMWVNDMGAAGATWATPGAHNWIAAEDAFYVVGSRVVGGMGAPEIVPFSGQAQAVAFADINGGQVMKMADIPDDAVLAPVILDGEDDDADFNKRMNDLSRTSGE